MSKRKTYVVVLVIFILAFLAGNLVFPKFLNLPYLPDVPFKLGLDLQGGIHLVYEADMSGIPTSDYSSSLQGLRDVIERRVNLFGVKEPTVQTQESSNQHRLIVELAGIDEPAKAIEMIGQTPYLEFKEYKENYQEIIDKNVEAREKVEVALEDPFQLTSLTGKYLKKAELSFDQTTYQPLVSLQFDDEGAKIFEELTSRNIGKPLAIYIDGLPISAPTVQEKISQGKAQISGRFTLEEAKTLARNLNAGALPVPITLISQETVGPALGKIALEKSLQAGIWGLAAVVIFMTIFYRLPGLLASLALVIYAILNLTLFKTIPVTLTLAGLGGFILSIGMAVDGNILIFSRMREELRQGKTFAIAVEEGFKRAWPAIWDGNFTLLIVAVILFSFGTSFVKGFAFTVIIGTLLSMFSAIIITKSFLRCLVGTKLEKAKFLWH
ncbi:MAG: protein-export membrane protein SecD [Candidatus Nealsonbacteria bacterium RIFCSPHIGHO2_02_FULL_43_13]|uniref:Protein translocase subunit SecD n=2 Tax=Candidatus Nealsoniibacteriota TaxID=1817911 RepID=A0A1G2E830_9BACT|nr:MAG: Preprotein translocase subunit SecD [Parcubacteria group bacterium GW2011_GWB1_43_6]OGZ21431.1 MAG: protein-export membrane protein SecD [Candidatus Nealsonbacteria bacterium RIFCSPHIGHO2_02_FULL_43_13]